MKRTTVLLTALLFAVGACLPALAADAAKPAEPAKAPAKMGAAAKPGAPGAMPSMGDGSVLVVIKTSKGSIVARLFPDKAPKSVENFLAYAKAGHYDGTIFHRVIPGFMIQGGGFTADMKEKPTLAPIKNEAGNGLKNLRGTLAMARTNVVDSATSQFYINLVDNPALDQKSATTAGFGYAVFGEVVSGMDGKSTMTVVDEIAKGKTGRVKGMDDVPTEAVTITGIKVMGGMGGNMGGGMGGGMPGGMGGKTK